MRTINTKFRLMVASGEGGKEGSQGLQLHWQNFLSWVVGTDRKSVV